MTVTSEEMECNTFADTTSATTTLCGIRLSNESLDQATDLAFLVEAHLTMLAGIDDSSDIGNRDTSFGNVAVPHETGQHFDGHVMTPKRKKLT